MSKFKRVMLALLKVAVAVAIIGGIAIYATSYVYGRKLATKLEDLKAKGWPVSIADINKTMPTTGNAAPMYDKVFALLKTPEYIGCQSKLAKEPKPGTPEWDAMRDCIVGLRHEIIPMIEQAASMPAYQVPLTSSMFLAGDPSTDEMSRRYTGMRQAARLLWMDAKLYVSDGDRARAIRSGRTSIELARHGLQMPFLIGHLVGVAICNISLASLDTVIKADAFDPGTPEVLFQELGQVQPIESSKMAWQTEGVISMSMMQNFPPTVTPARAWQVGILDRLEQVTNRMGTPYIHYKKWEDEVGESKNPFLDIMLPVFSRATAATYKAQAQVDMARIWLASEMYRTRFASYPKSLADIEQKLDLKLPIDPFNGKPYSYSLDGGKPKIASVGEDGKTSSDDITWPLSHSKR